MEIIIDCGDKELAKAIADKLSKDTGVARDKFKESASEKDDQTYYDSDQGRWRIRK
jgi:hypothetical protein